MARFGLLLLNKGRWNGQSLLGDTTFFNQMVKSSQNLNPAYGYLTWLNGKNSFIQPGLPVSFMGEIVPAAPADMYMAAGKNDQRIYVVPSQKLVVIRQGNAADSSALALSGFDDELWQLLNQVICQPAASKFHEESQLMNIYPNPAHDWLVIENLESREPFSILNSAGREIMAGHTQRLVYTPELASGLYILKINGESYRFIKN